MERNLLVGILGRGQNIARGGIQTLIAGIALVGAVFGIFQLLGDFVAARLGFDFAFLLHPAQKSIVVAHVVSDLGPPGTIRGGHKFSERS